MNFKRRLRKPVATPDQTDAPEAPGSAIRQRETAEYLADMILELRNLARAHQLYTVMVPLEYAYYEAFGVANRVDIPQSEIERIRELSKVSQQMEQPPQG